MRYKLYIPPQYEEMFKQLIQFAIDLKVGVFRLMCDEKYKDLPIIKLLKETAKKDLANELKFREVKQLLRDAYMLKNSIEGLAKLRRCGVSPKLARKYADMELELLELSSLDNQSKRAFKKFILEERRAIHFWKHIQTVKIENLADKTVEELDVDLRQLKKSRS